MLGLGHHTPGEYFGWQECPHEIQIKDLAKPFNFKVKKTTDLRIANIIEFHKRLVGTAIGMITASTVDQDIGGLSQLGYFGQAVIQVSLVQDIALECSGGAPILNNGLFSMNGMFPVNIQDRYLNAKISQRFGHDAAEFTATAGDCRYTTL